MNASASNTHPAAAGKILLCALAACGVISSAPAFAADTLKGQVLGAGAPIANSTVTLFAASAGAPRQLAQARTGADGRFILNPRSAPARDATLYLVARGGQRTAGKGSGSNPAIALMTVLGSTPPAEVTINEMTTVASVWTHNQFIDSTGIRGHTLGLKIAAGNAPSFVDLATGGWGTVIQDPLNSSQSPTMANFASLADVLAACITRLTPDACDKLFAATTPPIGRIPADTLTAAQSIAQYPRYQPGRLFALIADFYPVPQGKIFRMVPYMPYLNFAPSAWVLPLKYTGGSYIAGGKAMFGSEGNMWVGNNFIVGEQAQDSSWNGNATKFDGNGKPLSPHSMGFGWVPGGGIGGPDGGSVTLLRPDGT